MFRFLLFLRRKTHSQKRAQQALNDWEQCTCLGSDYYHKKDYKSAILEFEKALEHARNVFTCPNERVSFMHFYSLASMNLAQALNCYQQQPQSEQVLSDAHFNMLSVMVDDNEPVKLRYEARVQAEVLLKNLIDFLVSMGRNNVADNLAEEFTRLKITHST
jgi:ABC-type Fe2+-enterobactin transport system substrate-binding protein